MPQQFNTSEHGAVVTANSSIKPRRASSNSVANVRSTDVRPFDFHASEEELADLKRRVAATRWPERETIADQTIHYNMLPRSGDFAAWEQPAVLVQEVRAGFRTLR
jgi:hypothetical protein